MPKAAGIKGAWCASKCTAESLLPYISSGIIPELGATRWRIPGEETEPNPLPGEYVVFLCFLDRGLAFPSSLFFWRFLAYYRIMASDLGPHSIQQLALFVVVCEGFLGCALTSLCGSRCSTDERAMKEGRKAP